MAGKTVSSSGGRKEPSSQPVGQAGVGWTWNAPTPSSLPGKCWTPLGVASCGVTVSLKRTNGGFSTSLPVGFHISEGSGAVEEIVGVVPN